jgi:hypothetical protein
MQKADEGALMTRRRTTPPSARPEAAPTTFTADGRPVVRCAIYTRRSVARGEQEFTSCEAQRERVEDYVRAMKYEGWTVLDERFDDLGRSGGTLERPATFREVRERCGGVSPTVLNDRLREAGVLEHDEGEGYRCTAHGLALVQALALLDAWANGWARRVAREVGSTRS